MPHHSASCTSLQREREGALFQLDDHGNSYAGRSVVTSATIYRDTQDSLLEKKYARGFLISRNVPGACVTCWLWDNSLPLP